MAIRRFFMDWDQPALPLAVGYLARHFHDPKKKRLDMDQVLVVVPGKRAGRRLSQLLAIKARELDAVLFPPEIQTVGNLPENLYEPKRPFADDLTQHLAWVEAIKSQKPRAKKFFPHLPEKQETIDWLDMAAMLARVHRELAADGLDFADVVEQGRTVRGFAESRRWRFLRSLQESYLDILDGLELWDLQTARLFAIKHNECQTQKKIFLLGTVDLNQATRQMLKQVGTHVLALIHAPESEALGFDDFGCLIPYYWKERKIPIADSQVLVTDQPQDQANAVCHWISELGDSITCDNLVIGVPANEVALYIERKLGDYGLKSHWAVGKTVSESSPAKLLDSICAAIELDRYPEYAQLIRHPDLDGWLQSIAEDTDQPVAVADVIGESDAYYAEHLVPGFGPWLGDRKKHISLKWAIGELKELLKPLKDKSFCLSQWPEPILELLNQIYGHVEFDLNNDEDSMPVQALTQIRTILESFLEIPSSLDLQTDAVNVIRLILQKLGQSHVSYAPQLDSVELLGWLELPLDIAENVIVTSFNEGVIPESLNADMFLPNSMRQALELNDNQRRYARDAYAVSSLVHSKKEIRFVIGRRNLSGDPLMPSRIFFATDRETMARRVQQFAHPIEFLDVSGAVETGAESQFQVPYPDTKGIKVDSISVTSFKTFLKCRYRFYLQHVLKLKSTSDDGREMDAMAFGNFLHELFRRFGESRLRFSESETEIGEYMESEMEQLVRQKLGRKHLPAVEIQLQQIRHRLKGFARWQAGRTANGWEIKYVEKRPLDPGGVEFEFAPGRTVRLRGTIDRIDFHQSSETWQILDYKTGDKGDDPYRTHWERGEWVDLQLPLYRHIAKTFDVDGKVELGYILIPKSSKEIKESIARWSDQQIDEALDVARRCARQIVDLEFWEPTYPAPPFVGKEFASICQDNVFEPRLADPVEKGQQAHVESRTGGAI